MDEVKSRVIQYFLKNAPTGEHAEVVNELKAIVGADLLENEEIKQTLVDSLADQATEVQLGEETALATSLGKEETKFWDPKLAKTFQILDPLDLKGGEVEDAQGLGDLESLQIALDQYLSQRYSTGSVRVFPDPCRVVLVCNNVNLRNFWSGSWKSTWEIQGRELKGTVSIKAHYFEEGNLQLKTAKEVQGTLGSDDLAQEVPKLIAQLEDSVHSSMHSLYERLSSSVFKAMRRTMPVTHTKFADIHRTKMAA